MLDPSDNIFETEIEVLIERDKGRLMGHWLQHCSTEEERAEFAALLRNSHAQFDVLRNILIQMYQSAQNQKENLMNPNFKDRVAFEMGYQKALRDVYRLVPKTPKE